MDLCKMDDGNVRSAGDSAHLVPDFSRKLSISDADPEKAVQDNGEKSISDSAPQILKVSAEGQAATSKFTCSCGESFDRSVQLASHKRWNCKFREKTAQCEVCNGWFATEVGLKRHLKHAHGGSVSCDNCSLRFPNKIKLTRHWIEAHYDETKEENPNLKCFVCNDTNFDNKFELECHLVVHKYEKHQQKMSDHGLWSQQASVHYSPYPHMPFMKHFNYLPRPPPHFFPFHRPPVPFFPRHPPPFFSPPNFSFHPTMFNSQDPVSSHLTAEDSNAVPTTETTSQMSQESLPQSEETNASQSTPPRHDHIFTESVPSPSYYRHHKAHGKMKWKKYMKLMIKGKAPYFWQDKWLHQTREAGASILNPPTEKSNEQSEFQIACKFCETVIPRNRINWHQHKECPVLSIHKCSICDRVFKKRHFLLRHMRELNHFAASDEQDMTCSSDTHSSNLSVIQEKLNTSLKLLKVSDSFSIDMNKDNQNCVALGAAENSFLKDLHKNDQSSEAQVAAEAQTSPVINSNENMNAQNTKDKSQIQCCVCRLYFCNKDIRLHLSNHIIHVNKIQKVHEWTLKSSDYFFLNNPDDDDLNTASSSSCLDTEITSTTESLGPDNVSETSDRKWTMPHNKNNGHLTKGEILLCEFCSEQFSFRKDLHYHMETQHKDCSLKCPLCKKKFSWKKRGKFYERHLNSHFGVKVFKYKCEVCEKTFLENSKLRAHMSLHNNDLLHRCTVCQKGYANKSSLVRHERLHTGIKPYQCDVCSESFMEKRELIRHSTTHTGVAPFSCLTCGQGFTLKTSLMSHMKKKRHK